MQQISQKISRLSLILICITNWYERRLFWGSTLTRHGTTLVTSTLKMKDLIQFTQITVKHQFQHNSNVSFSPRRDYCFCIHSIIKQFTRCFTFFFLRLVSGRKKSFYVRTWNVPIKEKTYVINAITYSDRNDFLSLLSETATGYRRF